MGLGAGHREGVDGEEIGLWVGPQAASLEWPPSVTLAILKKRGEPR